MISIAVDPNQQESLIIQVRGSGPEFRRDVARIKRLQGRKYDAVRKVWSIDRRALDDLVALFEEQAVDWRTPLWRIRGEAPPTRPFDFPIEVSELGAFHGRVYDFQTVAACFLYQRGRAVLGDEVGVGKTASAIRAYLKGWLAGTIKSALVITKASLKHQFAKEVLRFTSQSVLVIGGSAVERRKQWAQADAVGIVVVNYELLLCEEDFTQMKARKWDAMICDEVHMVKNLAAQRTKQLLRLKSTYWWGLTGTPIQNRAEEIFTLMKFVDPDLLGSKTVFQKRYCIVEPPFWKVVGYRNLPELHEKISPYLLRRTQDELDLELPEVLENTYYVDMAPTQAKLHAKVERMLRQIDGRMEKMALSELVAGRRGRGFDRLTAMYQGYLSLLVEICDSPQLLAMSESESVREWVQGLGPSALAGAKIDELVDVVKEFLDLGHKVVVFTMFERMLRLISERLSKVSEVALLSGDLPANCSMLPDVACGTCAKFATCRARRKSQWRFQNEPGCRLFLSTDAGSAGLNLQNAKAVINFDLPWNPSDLDQRNGRIRRVGSSHRHVNVINLVAKGGIDEAILKVHERKRTVITELVEKTDEDAAWLESVMNRLWEATANGGREHS